MLTSSKWEWTLLVFVALKKPSSGAAARDTFWSNMDCKGAALVDDAEQNARIVRLNQSHGKMACHGLCGLAK